MKKTRLLLADDHVLFTEALQALLEDEFEIVGVAADGRSALAMAEKTKPDMIIMDISMPLLNGIDTGRVIHKRLPRTKIIFVSVHDDAEYVAEAFRSGASAYVVKRSAASELRTAIYEALGGRAYVTPLVTREVLSVLVNPERQSGPNLTVRQREVLQLAAEGRTLKEIAAVLNISVKTVEFHKSRISKELGIQGTAELTRYALAHGLIEK
jgi:DNA-binding NarL/FixJ family response regulator